MKKYMLIISIIFIAGCENTVKNGASEIIIGKCKYAVYRTGRGVTMVHAGDCSNHNLPPTQLPVLDSAAMFQ